MYALCTYFYNIPLRLLNPLKLRIKVLLVTAMARSKCTAQLEAQVQTTIYALYIVASLDYSGEDGDGGTPCDLPSNRLQIKHSVMMIFTPSRSLTIQNLDPLALKSHEHHYRRRDNSVLRAW